MRGGVALPVGCCRIRGRAEGPLELCGDNIKERPLGMAGSFLCIYMQLLRRRCAVGGELDLTTFGFFSGQWDRGREWSGSCGNNNRS